LATPVSHLAQPEIMVSIICRKAGRDGRGLFTHRIVVDEAAYDPNLVQNEVLKPMLLDKNGDSLLASSQMASGMLTSVCLPRRPMKPPPCHLPRRERGGR